MPKSKPRIGRRKTRPNKNKEGRIAKGYTPSEWKEYCRQKLGMKKETVKSDVPMEAEQMKPREKYGEYITGKRIEKGLALKQLSAMSGVSERNLAAIETEKANNYSFHDLNRYLKALEIPLSEVIL